MNAWKNFEAPKNDCRSKIDKRILGYIFQLKGIDLDPKLLNGSLGTLWMLNSKEWFRNGSGSKIAKRILGYTLRLQGMVLDPKLLNRSLDTLCDSKEWFWIQNCKTDPWIHFVTPRNGSGSKIAKQILGYTLRLQGMVLDPKLQNRSLDTLCDSKEWFWIQNCETDPWIHFVTPMNSSGSKIAKWILGYTL